MPTSPELKALRGNAIFRERYEQERIDRRRAFLSYLESLGAHSTSDHLTVVDVGWKGTMQDSLTRLLEAALDDRASKVTGLYMGLVGPVSIGSSNSKRGLLFSSVGHTSPWFHVFSENRPLFETLLAAEHASVSAYAFDEQGRATAVHDRFAEESLVSEVLLPAQRLIEERFHRLDELLMRRRYSPSWLLAQAAKRHARMVFSASPREIEWFTGLYHLENFGAFGRSTFHGPVRSGAFARARFAVSLLRSQERVGLGPWPWLRCLQQGGRPVAAAYRVGRNVQAAISR
jgi:hypothetical protein